MRKVRGRASWAAGIVLLAAGILPAITAGAPAAHATGSLQGNGSVDEAWLTGATPGDSITLLQGGNPVAVAGNPGTADALGSLIIRNLAAGGGYSWDDTTASATVGPFSVLPDNSSPAATDALYSSQPMHAGLNYITMRDGIRLAATVRFPYNGSAVVPCTAAAPCPTVIEYSGYGTAGPSDPIPPILASNPSCAGCGDPHLLPDGATEIGGVLARVNGFATVSLQMRGTGCSGGAYDLLGFPSDYDAYDAIETVAHQSWVANHKVGMVGISYSGLSQFPSAGTDPPDLAAIAPLSPTDDLFSTGYPGGIFNNGFAASWIGDRIDDAMPAAGYSGGLVQLSPTPIAHQAQPWTYYEIDAELAATPGSSTCLDNQALHLESESLSSLVGPGMVAPGTGPGRDISLFDRRSMSVWASHVTVPVFVAGAAQDEQTGPQWPALLNALPASNRAVYANLVNGGHIDSTDPQILSRWLEFLDIYVAGQVPHFATGLSSIFLDLFTSFAAGTGAQAPLPALRFSTMKTVAKAQAAFAKQTPRMYALFDSGAGAVGAGDPQAPYTASFSQWPPKGKAEKFFFGAAGSLSTKKPKTSGSASLVLDPGARPLTSLPSGNPWASSPPWNWTTVPAADGVAFQTAPFRGATTFAGPATVQLWVESATPIEDYQVTVTEVRPGQTQEEYVTSGFLRSSNQTDYTAPGSLFTSPDYLAAAAGTLSPSSFTEVNIPVDPIVHTFRAGSALRIVISAPGGDRPSWTFATLDSGQSATIGFGVVAGSALLVNQVHGVRNTAAYPTCGTLRGEPCRAYQLEGNQ